MSIELRQAAPILTAILLVGTAARAEVPLSAIDWLSKSVATPAALPQEPLDEPAVSNDAGTQDIAVSILDAPSPDGAGLLSPKVTGLPRALWGLGKTEEIVSLIRSERPDTLPSLQALLNTLMLAEAVPPVDSGGRGDLLLARVDELLDVGALEQAQALLDAAGSNQPELFRRSFDVALLTGSEDIACERMRDNPELAPTFPARIFCLARSGDWNAAALTLRTAQALGFVTPEEDELLSRFLDPDLYEGEPPMAKPSRPTPLVWRMFEAIGEPLPTNTLPLAFAHAELRDTAGWKAQIEAAERLARTGAIAPNRLMGFYTDRKPAASGGVWDRVAGVQALDDALTAGNGAEVERILPGVWDLMATAELEVPFAELFASSLQQAGLRGQASAIAFKVALVSPDYAAAATARKAADPAEAFLIGLASGNIKGITPTDSLGRAIAPAFLNPMPSLEVQALVKDGMIGQAILKAIDQISEGLRGSNPSKVTEGLSLLRVVGLEDAARRTALELLLLERRG
ncbi:MAG: hypothetical protein DI533_01635 [Cereibacter sphaeroides]|uniref:Antifreeze glycopeptide polyprotein n=1 Tax=Cereibacter sphaeroides TaxID=1063 RepID=A0A2W5S8T8_CERSP|nr:MAG: hypothetical protein DI533_01635 [Cereibacter sphaeroides]